METRPKQVEIYEAANGERPYEVWFDRLRDRQAKARIKIYLSRIEDGNTRNCKPVGAGVFELSLHCGPGYRVYVGLSGASVVLLLCGGDKSTQASDIANAKTFWTDYLQSRSRKGMVASNAKN